MRKVYLCQNKIESMLSALYEAWVHHRDEDVGIELIGYTEHKLFCDYITVVDSGKKAASIEKLIRKNLGDSSYFDIYHALLADDGYKVEAVFKTIQAARDIQTSHRIMEHLTNDSVMKVFELSRRVCHEAHLFTGFVRFRELRGGILFSEISPKGQVLTCIAEHFYNRFPLENWLILDKTHNMSLVHPKEKPWFLVNHKEEEVSKLKKIADVNVADGGYEDLWQTFFTSVTIKERESYKRQRGNLPLWYRENMTEFQQKVKI